MIAKIRNHVSAIVQVNLTDAPAMPQGAPVYLGIEYLYEPVTDSEGWTDHTWRGYNAGVGGETAGGRHFHQSWTTLDGEELSSSTSKRNESLPLWIRELIDELRPSGDVSLPTYGL